MRNVFILFFGFISTIIYAQSALSDSGQTEIFSSMGRTTTHIHSTSYLTEQDGMILTNEIDLISNSNGTVTDLNSGLVWVFSADLNGDGDINILDKISYQDALTFAANSNYGGYNDWRVPTIKELYSIINFSGVDPSGLNRRSTSSYIPFIDRNFFDFGYGDTSAGERAIDAQFVSSTLYVSTTMNGDDTVFGVNFADGRIKGYPLRMRNQDKLYYLFLVRGNILYNDNDFSENINGTIIDQSTGLIWSKDDSGIGMDWYDALKWIVDKNDENYLGYSDWRLPNIKELQSIVDYTRSPDTTNSASINPIFNTTSILNENGEVDWPYFWSSTTHRNSSAVSGRNAAYISFGRAMGYMSGKWLDVHGAGSQRSDPKSGNPDDFPNGHGPQGDAIRIFNYVRLVRGGNAEYITTEPEAEEELDGITSPTP